MADVSSFDALANDVRREILGELRARPRTVGDLVGALGASQPLVSKHLRVLRDAGFVDVEVDAQRRWYRLQPRAFREIDRWLEPYRWMWEDRLDALGDTLEAMKAHDQAKEQS